MARQLWLLRHGEAVPHDAAPDPQRALTDLGRAQARDAGRALARLHDGRWVVVYASPKVRAWDTALGAAPALGLDPVREDRLAAGFDADVALELLMAADDGERVLVVGHEPDFSQVVRDLTGARIDLKKGGVAVVRVEGTAPSGELTMLLRPRELRAIAGS
jgi:phosphohistidine phosphatase